MNHAAIILLAALAGASVHARDFPSYTECTVSSTNGAFRLNPLPENPVFNSILHSFSTETGRTSPPSYILSGKVIPNNSAAPAEGVAVSICTPGQPPRLAAITNTEGEFRFRVWIKATSTNTNLQDTSLRQPSISEGDLLLGGKFDMNRVMVSGKVSRYSLNKLKEHVTVLEKIKVAQDGFPSGHETPEGAACDLARALINRDVALFKETCIREYDSSDYTQFLNETINAIKKEPTGLWPPHSRPKSLIKVFAARQLSKSGPASYCYATFGFQEVMFVDIGILLNNGSQPINRTLVIKDNNGKWYAHPMPSAGSGLLSIGLNKESVSVKDFTDVYEVLK